MILLVVIAVASYAFGIGIYTRCYICHEELKDEIDRLNSRDTQ